MVRWMIFICRNQSCNCYFDVKFIDIVLRNNNNFADTLLPLPLPLSSAL